MIQMLDNKGEEWLAPDTTVATVWGGVGHTTSLHAMQSTINDETH